MTRYSHLAPEVVGAIEQAGDKHTREECRVILYRTYTSCYSSTELLNILFADDLQISVKTAIETGLGIEILMLMVATSEAARSQIS